MCPNSSLTDTMTDLGKKTPSTLSGGVEQDRNQPSSCINKEKSELILKAVTSCSLKGQGTFYFLSEGINAEKRRQYTITFMDNEGKISPSSGFDIASSELVDKTVVINDITVLMVLQDGLAYAITTTDNWKTLNFTSNDPKEVLNTVMEGLSDAKVGPPFQTKGLSRVRAEGNHDFSITCKAEDDSDSVIRVHSVILKSSWPFFKKMMESDMIEVSERTLAIPYPMLWVEAMISFLYGEHRELSFEEATGLMIIADIYDIPFLLIQSMKRIKEEAMDLSKTIFTWKRAFQAQNEAVMEYCGASIFKDMKSLPKAQKIIQDFTQEEFLQLFKDMSLHAQKDSTLPQS